MRACTYIYVCMCDVLHACNCPAQLRERLFCARAGARDSSCRVFAFRAFSCFFASAMCVCVSRFVYVVIIYLLPRNAMQAAGAWRRCALRQLEVVVRDQVRSPMQTPRARRTRTRSRDQRGPRVSSGAKRTPRVH